MTTIMEIFNNIQFLKYIKLNHEIKAVYIGGSRMFDLNSDDSDYDLNIVVADPYFKSTFDNLNIPILYAKYRETSIHWYYVSKDFKINNQYSNYIYDIWMCQLYFGIKDTKNIIKVYDKNYFNEYVKYINDSYPTHIQNVKKKYSSLLFHYINNKDYLNILNNSNKLIYFLCLLGYLCTNTEIDKQMLMRLKKYSKRNLRRFTFETINSLSEEDKDTINKSKEILSKLYNYLQTI